MIIGIDASSVRSGGGLSYLAGLLCAAQPSEHGIDRIIVWSSRATLEALPDRPWLDLRSDPLLDGPLPFRLFWQRFRFSKLAQDCDLFFAPGGTAPYPLHPLVTVSQNMLPFQQGERGRYGTSWIGQRLRLLRHSQSNGFARSDGVIFLSQFAREVISQQVRLPALSATIAHGVDEVFRKAPRPARRLEDCSDEEPMRLLYVSIVDLYKHHWHVAEAVAKLRARGWPIVIDFVGPDYPPALARLKESMVALDPDQEFLRYHGAAAQAALAANYHSADLFVFASSCENLPIIMIEAMAAGLPIASAKRGPMPEVLLDAGRYFDPEDPADIEACLAELIESPDERAVLAQRAFTLAESYSWPRCARETLAFLARVRSGNQPDA